MLRRSPLFAMIVCVAAVTPARAAEFSWEPFGYLSRFDQRPLETEQYSLGATRFFAPVDDAAGPYGLATFLDPATRLSVAMDHERREVPAIFGPFQPISTVTETDDYSVAGRYVFPRSKWYAGGVYRWGDVTDPPFVAPADTDLDGYGAVVGKYLGADTTLELTYDSAETRRVFPVSCSFPLVCSGDSSTATQTDQWDIGAQHVHRGRALTYSLTGRVAEISTRLTIRSPQVTVAPGFVVRPILNPGVVGGGAVAAFVGSNADVDLGELHVYSVGGELFPTQRFGVRIGYSSWDGDTGIDDAYDVTATWFATRNIGLAFTFSRQNNKNSLLDAGDTAAVRIIGRL